jgi:hypothetical protein
LKIFEELTRILKNMKIIEEYEGFGERVRFFLRRIFEGFRRIWRFFENFDIFLKDISNFKEWNYLKYKDSNNIRIFEELGNFWNFWDLFAVKLRTLRCKSIIKFNVIKNLLFGLHENGDARKRDSKNLTWSSKSIQRP